MQNRDGDEGQFVSVGIIWRVEGGMVVGGCVMESWTMDIFMPSTVITTGEW